MKLDLTALNDAIAQLEEALEYHGSEVAARDPALKLHLRAAAIQAFEFTYELSFKMIKRYLEQASENPALFDEMSFSAIMRDAFQRGLLRSELASWKEYRKLRGTTSHTYDEDKARVVFESVPAFLREARYVRDQLRRRNESLDGPD
ncbi:MAG: HI0074 family nucleotidyltransferase substrate-binding subunit [Acidobacteriota bacterium]|nr:HI0074 family nucleotidyltransferase substrate-binding subunit [Acidobacteriota bacterium]MDE3266684.1 HI0074 family nucleotidyltransferase substrate-binding subunit [Acidobacteriota bacterium]